MTDNLSLFLDGVFFAVFIFAIVVIFIFDSYSFFNKEFAFKKVGFTPYNIAYLVFYLWLTISSLRGLF